MDTRSHVWDNGDFTNGTFTRRRIRGCLKGQYGTQNTSVTYTVAAATTTTVASNNNASTYGQSVTFTATVTSTATPTGNVNFVIDGGSPIAGTAGATTATTATWTYTTSGLNATNGTPHTVSASYVASGSFGNSNGSLSGGQVVNKATPTATLAVSNSPQTYTGSGLAATVDVTVELGAGRGGEHADRRGGDADDGRDVRGARRTSCRRTRPTTTTLTAWRLGTS